MTVPALRARPELVMAARRSGAQRQWVVEDPVAAKYFQLGEEEYFILGALDGRTTIAQLKRQFEQRFYPLRLSPRQLAQFLHQLHQLGLVVSNTLGQGDVLLDRRRTNRLRQGVSMLASPLAIRFPGLPARRAIDRLYPWLRPLLSPAMLACWALLVGSALLLVTVRVGSFHQRLPTLGEFFSPQLAVWFIIALAVTKGLHELGHALVSRHFGGSCRQIGPMLLALVPTLYCDVSDAWRVPCRRQRLLIAMAGVMVELVVAAIATWLWWFSQPGMLRELLLRIMFFCSVSSLLFNANPLIRADAYYGLSDLVNVPNLWQESRLWWRRLLANWLTGRHWSSGATTPPAWAPALLAYAAASTIYCWLLVAGIVWFLWRVLEPSGLGLIAWLMAALVFSALLAPSLRAAARGLASPGGRRAIRGARLLAAFMLLLLVLGIVGMLPLPHRVTTPAWLEPLQARRVYVPVAGRLQDAVAEGSLVRAGQPLATLGNPDVELAVAEWTAEVENRASYLESLRRLEAADSSVTPLIPVQRESLAAARGRLSLWRQDHQQLVLTSPVDGVVYAPPLLRHPSDDRARLLPWQQSPLQPSNRGAWLEVGQQLCLVGDPRHFHASLIVPQTLLADIRPGQRVTIRLDQLATAKLSGVITEVGKKAADDLTAAQLRQFGLTTTQPTWQRPQQAEQQYQALVKLDQPVGVTLRPEMTGKARIWSDPKPLVVHLRRFLARHFTVW